jgi:hypothetical protein
VDLRLAWHFRYLKDCYFASRMFLYQVNNFLYLFQDSFYGRVRFRRSNSYILFVLLLTDIRKPMSLTKLQKFLNKPEPPTPNNINYTPILLSDSKRIRLRDQVIANHPVVTLHPGCSFIKSIIFCIYSRIVSMDVSDSK